MRYFQIIFLCLVAAGVATNGGDLLIASAQAKAGKAIKEKGRKGKLKISKSADPGDVWERIGQGIRIPVPNPVAGLEDIDISRTVELSRLKSVYSGSMVTDSPSARLTTVIAPKKSDQSESLQISEKLRAKHILNPYKRHLSESAANPEDRYTKLGRLKLTNKDGSSGLIERLKKKTAANLQEQAVAAKSDALFKSSTGRIRTRLGLNKEISSETKVDSKNDLGSGKKLPILVAQNQPALKNCADLHKPENINLAKKGVLSVAYHQMLEQCRTKQAAINDRISQQMNIYSRGYLSEISERARPFLYHIVDSLNKYNLPLDLALLPIVESAYKPTALSPASAAGIWQFIPSTGRTYGLEQNGLYDARLDVTASTHAAIRFLSGLRDHYKGDWLLALAAYNAGPGTVDAAISRNLEEGLDTDYWSLPLPLETQNYVPRLLGLARIFSSPSGYGLKLRPLKNEPYFIKVKIDRESDINQLVGKQLVNVARLANFDQQEFSLLNTAYVQPKLTKAVPLQFHMPIVNANLLHRSLDFMANSNWYQGDKWPLYPELAFSSDTIGNKLKSPLVTLAMNDDPDFGESIKTLPTPGVQESKTQMSPNTKANVNSLFTVHYLDKGESLKTLAEYHGLTESFLREVNKLKRRESLALGQRLFIPLKEIAIASISRNKSSILFRGLN